MKKILNFAAVAVAAASLCACENFLDTTNYWSKTTEDFPANAEDALQVLTGIYNNLNTAQLSGVTDQTKFMWSNAASDDCLGGGGSNDPTFQAKDLLLNYGADMYNNIYCERYIGIARANTAIETFANCGLDEATLNQYLGEAYFLRAYYYYELALMFGNIPVPTSSSANPKEPQKSGEALWGQIFQDLKTAVSIMPSVKATGDGHVDKYCAEALLGRAYLFYSGFFGSETCALPDGGSIAKAEVAAAIDDCVKNSGYSLVPDFHNLWPYTTRVVTSDPLYPAKWAGKGYKYVCDDYGVNPEAMFMIKYNTRPSWSVSTAYTNCSELYAGLRGQTDTYSGGQFPFGGGWGMNPVSPSLVADWQAAEPGDQRFDASIIATNTFGSWTFGGEKFTQETGYFSAKSLPVIARKEDNSGFWACYDNAMYSGLSWDAGLEDDMQLNHLTDQILIRFAEVLLMDAELNNNQASFDAVRARAGLASKPITVDNIRAERRWELAFEGIRFEDMRRYGVDYCKLYLDKQDGVKAYFSGVEGTNDASKFNGGYGKRYEETKGFVALPSSQIALSASAGAEYKYKQNDGWAGGATDFGGWN